MEDLIAARNLPRLQRMMLPAALIEPDSRSRSPRDWLIDVTIVLISVGIGVLVLAPTWSDRSTAMQVFDVALGVIAIASLSARRRHPMAVGVFTGLAGFISGAAAMTALVATFNAAIRGSTRAIAVSGVLCFVAGLVYPLFWPSGESYVFSLAFGALLTVLVLVCGLFVRSQRLLLRSLNERMERADADRRMHADQARETERKRIAHEMHDVLAHHMSLLSLHAGALEFRRDASREEVGQAAGVIRASANAALAELREVIGVLRDPGAGTEPPQPKLDEVAALIEDSRAAGMRIEFRDSVNGTAVPTAAGRTAYRVVQEGLTNARKHSPGAAVDVWLGSEGGELVAEIANGPAARVPGPQPEGAGTGLIGLAERVGLAGGRLEHGRAGGTFTLRAVLPLAGEE